jgi:hypothetical protein
LKSDEVEKKPVTTFPILAKMGGPADPFLISINTML